MMKTRKSNVPFRACQTTYRWLLAAALLGLVACGGLGHGSESGRIGSGGQESIGSASQALTATLAWPSNVVTAGPKVGTLAGRGRVNVTGQYEYTLPIPLPEGRASMTPEVSLRYSSDAPNGEVGVGWGLAASSVISFCPQTYATDGALAQLALDGSDPMCLDGQRLVSSAVKGEYRTEAESFAKVVAPSTTYQPWSSTSRTVEFENIPR
jgi:hypothetical protein